jgi:hypothetical protein
MKRNVVGAKPTSGSKYLKASKDTKPYMILLGVSLEGKKGALGGPCSTFFKKATTNIDPESIMRRIEASKGNKPAPGKWIVPMGYWRDLRHMINPNRNRTAPVILSESLMTSRHFHEEWK